MYYIYRSHEIYGIYNELHVRTVELLRAAIDVNFMIQFSLSRPCMSITSKLLGRAYIHRKFNIPSFPAPDDFSPTGNLRILQI